MCHVTVLCHHLCPQGLVLFYYAIAVLLWLHTTCLGSISNLFPMLISSSYKPDLFALQPLQCHSGSVHRLSAIPLAGLAHPQPQITMLAWYLAAASAAIVG